MKLRNKKTGEVREARIVNEHLQLWQTNLEKWVDYDDLNYLAKWWERYEEPKEYWYIDCYGEVLRSLYNGNEWDERRKLIGNYFKTKEEAELAVRKLKAWKRLKDNGFEIKGWRFTPDMKQIQGNYVKIEAEIPQILINEKDLDLFFGGEGDEI